MPKYQLILIGTPKTPNENETSSDANGFLFKGLLPDVLYCNHQDLDSSLTE